MMDSSIRGARQTSRAPGLNFSHVAPEQLDEGLKRLADVLRQALLKQVA